MSRLEAGYSVGEVKPFHSSFRTRNKGRRSAVIKPVHVSDAAGLLLREYFQTKRRAVDPLTPEFEQWCQSHRLSDLTPEEYARFLKDTNRQPSEVALFLTSRGTPYTANSFRKGAWRPSLAAAGVSARPHQARHWFVTSYLQGIDHLAAEQPAQYQLAREALGRYMGWVDPERMLRAYDQSLSEYRVRARMIQIRERIRQGPPEPALQKMGHLLGAADTVTTATAPGPIARQLAALKALGNL